VTRDEHLEFAKKRALEYLDRDNNPQEAFTSMLSDLRKHPDLKNHIGGEMGVMLMLLPGWIDNRTEVRRWIVGFN
jgi:hypothetical protein